jgi:hypothetical protein
MDAPRLLTHGDDAAARGCCRCEVDVCELGEGVAYLIVNRALTYFTAFDMGDGDA